MTRAQPPCPRYRCRRLTRGGFTLMELVVIMAIIATIAAIAAPRYARAVGRFRADAIARRVRADLAYAQRIAEATSSPVTVQFNVTTDAYSLPGVVGPDRTGPPYSIDLTASPYLGGVISVVFDDPLDADDAPNEIIFSGFGLPDSGGQVVVGSGHATKTVSVDPDTGQAQVQ